MKLAERPASTASLKLVRLPSLMKLHATQLVLLRTVSNQLVPYLVMDTLEFLPAPLKKNI
jgi:hypothetical protein